MESYAGDVQAQRRRRLLFVHSACRIAIAQLDRSDLYELGLSARLLEVVEMIENDLDRLIHD